METNFPIFNIKWHTIQEKYIIHEYNKVECIMNTAISKYFCNDTQQGELIYLNSRFKSSVSANKFNLLVNLSSKIVDL